MDSLMTWKSCFSYNQQDVGSASADRVAASYPAVSGHSQGYDTCQTRQKHPPRQHDVGSLRVHREKPRLSSGLPVDLVPAVGQPVKSDAREDDSFVTVLFIQQTNTPVGQDG